MTHLFTGRLFRTVYSVPCTTKANEKLATVDQDAIARSTDPDRSPSPPPRYDGNGVRTNNRNVRMRAALNKERTKVIEEMMKLNPMFRPPADFVKSKPHRKLYIPTDEYPGYNFIGGSEWSDSVFLIFVFSFFFVFAKRPADHISRHGYMPLP